MDALRKTVDNFNGRLIAAESLAGGNLERITSTEKTVKLLQAQNQYLQDHLHDLENRSGGLKVRIINIPEGSDKGQDLSNSLLPCWWGTSALTSSPSPRSSRGHTTLCLLNLVLEVDPGPSWYSLIIFRRRRRCFVGWDNVGLSTARRRWEYTRMSALPRRRNEPLSTKSNKPSTRKEWSLGFFSSLTCKFRKGMIHSLLILRRTRRVFLGFFFKRRACGVYGAMCHYPPVDLWYYGLPHQASW